METDSSPISPVPAATPCGLRARVHEFLDRPHTFAACIVQAGIYVLILASGFTALLEYGFPEQAAPHLAWLQTAEYFFLVVFTVEYLLRLWAAPNRPQFVVRPWSIIDLLAILPGLTAMALEATVAGTELRLLRLIRVLRFLRVLRILRLLRVEFFGKLFQFQNTVLQAILPVMVLFLVGKGVVWLLEWAGLWKPALELGELFAIIGFSLGIVLAQKVAATYEKFVQVEESEVHLANVLAALEVILDQARPGDGTRAIRTWARLFLSVLTSREVRPAVLRGDPLWQANHALYAIIKEHEPQPADLTNMYVDITRVAAFLLHKKGHRTPRPYDSLLLQATIIYACLLTLFLPGVAGLLSVAIAVYVLYGMYYLTQDLDAVMGGEFRLIAINLTDLLHIAEMPHHTQFAPADVVRDIGPPPQTPVPSIPTHR